MSVLNTRTEVLRTENAGLRFGQIIRRRLSVMVVDIADSTQFATSHDLEEVRDLLLAFLEAATTRIELHQGYVARYMGDGLLAYFGYPISQEQAAISAVAAGLEAQSAFGRIIRSDGLPLRARIGIATGEVTIGDIVGDGLASECMVIGPTANLAVRLQSVAQSGEVLVCPSTFDLCGDAFEAKITVPLQLKGFKDHVVARRILHMRDVDRFDARLGLGIAPLTGREGELALLRDGLATSRSGTQSWLISGAAGIGKSRLLFALKAEANMARYAWLATAGAASAVNTPFFGLARLVRAATEKGVPLGPDAHARRFAALARRLGIDMESASRLTEAAGLPLTRYASPPVHDPAILTTKLRDDCALLLRRATALGPIVIAIEDRHWLDASTTELLESLLPVISDLPVMIVATSRDRPTGFWTQANHIQLGTLSHAELRKLIKLAAGGALSEDAQAQILARAGGNPLFAEELARLLARTGDNSEVIVPESLSDLLLHRVDRGPHGLAVAQAIALLGEDALRPAIAELAGLDSASVDRALDRLIAEDVVIAEASGEAPIGFRHALFADAAYSSQPRKLRSAAHLVAARLLEQRKVPANRVARHYDEANETERAIHWWQSAGKSARSGRAMPEAAAAFARAIHLLGEPEPEDLVSQPLFLELHADQFEALQIAHGYSAEQTTSASERLRKLVERHGDLEQQMLAVTGQWAAASSAGQYELANRHALRAPAIARALGTSDALAAAAMIQMTARYRVGDLVGATDAWQSGLPHFDNPIFVKRPGAVAQNFGNGAILAWLLGQKDQMNRCIARLGTAKTVLTDNYNQTFLFHMIALTELLRDGNAIAEKAAHFALEISEQAGFPHYVSIARVALGAAQSRLGDLVGGIAEMRKGLAGMEESSSRSGVTTYQAWLADAELRANEPEMALGSIARALRLCPEERYFLPELLRLRAIAEARLGRTERFAPLLGEALESARAMHATGLFHRIAASRVA